MPESDRTTLAAAAQAARGGAHPMQAPISRLGAVGRAGFGLARLDTYRLDIKLGLRVLFKFWGLTLFGGLAMAMAITLGASVFELLRVATGTTVPLDEGDRVVMIQPIDPRTQQTRPASIEDFERWRTDLRSVEDVGAFTAMERDLTTASGPAPPVPVAEMSAAGFGLARVAPLRGRFLLPEDERPDAPPVLVIGYDAWQSTFAGNASIVGQTVQLDGVFHTVVGVMPEGFGFPFNHQYWKPLQARAAERVAVFARLAPGAALETAQAEVESLGLLEPDAPADAQLRPRLVPYVLGILGAMPAITALVPLILPLLLIPPCVNIAVLVYGPTPASLRFAPGEYLTASVSVDPQSNIDPVRFANVRDELVRRLQGEPGIPGVTVADGLPSQESQIRVQAEGTGAVNVTAFNRVDLGFFDTFNTGVLTGRGFEASDFESDRNAIVVNRSFARRVLGDGNPIGRRVRTVVEDAVDGELSAVRTGPWLEVVGVVEDFSAEGGRRTLYQPLPLIPDLVPVSSNVADSPAPPLKLAIHVGPTIPSALPGRLREIAASLDPDLRIDPVVTFDLFWESFWIEDGTIASVLAGLLLGIVAFAVAGVYTLMAFTVVQRRHEIAIRSALGATPWRLTTGIFRRVLAPVIVGATLGGLAALLAEYYWSPLLFEFREGGRALPWSLPLAETVLIAIGLLAASGPARRALRFDPVEDLRDV